MYTHRAILDMRRIAAGEKTTVLIVLMRISYVDKLMLLLLQAEEPLRFSGSFFS